MTPEEMANLHGQAMKYGTPWSSAAFESSANRPGSIVVTDQAGFALGRCIANEAELLTIAVRPELQRSGHGRNLIEVFEAKATSMMADTVFLEVASRNAPARQFYESAGYVEAGRRRNYYQLPAGQTDDALILRKLLNN